MKKIRRTLFLVLTLCMAACLLAPSCFAANYSITVHAGNRGEILGQDLMQVNAGYNGRTNLQDVIDRAKVTDEKYYIRGVRLAGHDNNEQLDNVNVAVTEDAEYVLVYAIKGDMTKYTVRYLSANGTVLAPETTGYANIGDKIVVGCKDVDGYTPNAYNLTKTLTANEADNVLTFRYSVTPPTQTQVIVLPGNNNNNNANANANNNANANANANANNNANANANENNNETAQAVDAEEPAAEAVEVPAEETAGGLPVVETTPEPVEIIDLDEEEVPLADLEDVEPKKDNKAKIFLVLGCVLVMALFAVIMTILGRRKRLSAVKESFKDDYDEDIDV